MRPVIGITCAEDEVQGRAFLARPYYEAVVEAGGVPLLIPAVREVEEVLRVLDGLIFSGGGDVDPLFFGEEPLPESGEISPDRDLVELKLAKKAMSMGIPILGICRGAQVLNIAAGGTIYQDISLGYKTPLKHSQQAPRWYPTHTINIDEESILAKLLGEKLLRVNSYHHQCLAKMGSDFKVVARSQDEVIEAFEGTGNNFVLGVQFHPETMWRRDRRFLKLFEVLIKGI
ncbi:gamma-glutamyl-gamma-aminobutyrate hydrolase family protein [Desulfolucanica intricata]|uniref:gamma-glutamyl-gamma-aminobutyrate hydrolase family protein n=1 Tax=Desulfolucanica intricata TaxID=1285191 RepID=UPI0008321F98|nr:gamma-glutamyl-gamma-aminobutyrate hydrolase family protein [Desulfolucanica intricata]